MQGFGSESARRTVSGGSTTVQLTPKLGTPSAPQARSGTRDLDRFLAESESESSNNDDEEESSEDDTASSDEETDSEDEEGESSEEDKERQQR